MKNAPSQIGLLGDRKDEFLGIRIPIWSHVLGFKASLVDLDPNGFSVCLWVVRETPKENMGGLLDCA